MYEFILIFFIVLSGVLGYVVFNLLRKLEVFEAEVEKFEKFIYEKEIGYKFLLEKMRKIDERQMFEKDDDVGSVFDGLKKLIEDYENF
jgi:hypothetical protein